MNRTLTSALLLALLSVTAPEAQSQARTAAPIRSPLIGAWRLVSLEEPGADGKVHTTEASGLFVFTADGHAAVQVMKREAESAPSGGPVQYSIGGYEASFGKFTVDARAKTFDFRIEGALVRALIGKDHIRHFEIAGKRLVVTSVNADEHWRVTWERY